ncbi:MAG: hypothetical protein M1834_001597 [Cirrosporium novae-zelandiae]|nr:MAG: hypothetical protein M1834_004114 [Cirrosporium novae-zelandiae]KAI9735581.1 MAG: hypothetical protein M1834_001597 [Cirrosporium novae-zelandiae]
MARRVVMEWSSLRNRLERTDLDEPSPLCPEENQTPNDPLSPEKAAERVERWKKVLDYFDPNKEPYVYKKAYPEYIYRAFSNSDLAGFYKMRYLIPTFGSDLYSPNLRGKLRLPEQEGWSVFRFARVLRRNTRKRKEGWKTALVSASGNLQWTVHRAGQNDRYNKTEGKKEEDGCLAVFRFDKIKKELGTFLYDASDIIDYIDPHLQFFSSEERAWAISSQEYIAWGYIPTSSLVHWTFWSDLYSPQIGFLLPAFEYWFKLGDFHRKHIACEVDAEEYIKRTVKFAYKIAGPDCNESLLKTIIGCVESPSCWGYILPNDEKEKFIEERPLMRRAKVRSMIELNEKIASLELSHREANNMVELQSSSGSIALPLSDTDPSSGAGENHRCAQYIAMSITALLGLRENIKRYTDGRALKQRESKLSKPVEACENQKSAQLIEEAQEGIKQMRELSASKSEATLSSVWDLFHIMEPEYHERVGKELLKMSGYEYQHREYVGFGDK